MNLGCLDVAVFLKKESRRTGQSTKKAPEHTRECQENASKPAKDSKFDDCISGKLLTGCTALSVV